MPARKVAPKPDHLSRILDAASELFLELGFDRTSTADIARRAKVSKRELYTHFADKRAILSAAITGLQNSMGSEMYLEWSATGDLRSILLHAGTAIFNFIASKKFRNLFRIVATESFHDRLAARKFYLLGPGAGRQQTAKFLERQMRSGNLRKTEPLQAADDFLDMVITARFMTAIALGRKDPAIKASQHIAHAVDVFLAYYAPRKSHGSPRKATTRRDGAL